VHTIEEPIRLSVGAFAAAAEVNLELFRFYHRKGLLPEPTLWDRPSGVRWLRHSLDS
jgi:hypothetical protein